MKNIKLETSHIANLAFLVALKARYATKTLGSAGYPAFFPLRTEAVQCR